MKEKFLFNQLLGKKGFLDFFTFNQKKFFFEEIIDYYVNIVKSLAMKINKDTNMKYLRAIFLHVI